MLDANLSPLAPLPAPVMTDSSWINVRASDKQQRANKEKADLKKGRD